MGDFGHRIMNSFLASEALPASARLALMRKVGFKIARDSCIWAGGSFRSKNLEIGSGVFINVGFFFDGYDHLTVGDNVRIGQFVRVLTATHHIGPSGQRGMIEVVGKAVHIEPGCWIGSGVTILPGVTIQKSCVIAANSVVTECTDPDGLYAGNPAMRVRDLD